MGYCYGTDYATGRQSLCCDICGSLHARKVPCPVGYCPAVAACEACRKAKKHIPPDRHASCRARLEDSARKLAQFRRGGLHFYLRYEPLKFGQPSESPYIIEGAWYFTACDHFNRTWLRPVDLEELTRLGHTFTILPEGETRPDADGSAEPAPVQEGLFQC